MSIALAADLATLYGIHACIYMLSYRRRRLWRNIRPTSQRQAVRKSCSSVFCSLRLPLTTTTFSIFRTTTYFLSSTLSFSNWRRRRRSRFVWYKRGFHYEVTAAMWLIDAAYTYLDESRCVLACIFSSNSFSFIVDWTVKNLVTPKIRVITSLWLHVHFLSLDIYYSRRLVKRFLAVWLAYTAQNRKI